MDEQEGYLGLLYQLGMIKKRIGDQQRVLHDWLVQEHKWWFITLHVLVFIAILFNIGALVLSNAMIVKDSAVEGVPQIEFREANPFSIQTGFKTAGLMIGLLSLGMMMRLVVYWVLMLIGYSFLCKNVYSKQTLWLLTILVVYLVCTTGIDFFHDFGFVLGTILMGGRL